MASFILFSTGKKTTKKSESAHFLHIKNSFIFSTNQGTAGTSRSSPRSSRTTTSTRASPWSSRIRPRRPRSSPTHRAPRTTTTTRAAAPRRRANPSEVPPLPRSKSSSLTRSVGEKTPRPAPRRSLRPLARRWGRWDFDLKGFLLCFSIFSIFFQRVFRQEKN